MQGYGQKEVRIPALCCFTQYFTYEFFEDIDRMIITSA